MADDNLPHLLSFSESVQIKFEEYKRAVIREDREAQKMTRQSNRLLTFPDGTPLKLSDTQGAAVRIASEFDEGGFHVNELIVALQAAGEIPDTHSGKFNDLFKDKSKREALFESLGKGFYRFK